MRGRERGGGRERQRKGEKRGEEGETWEGKEEGGGGRDRRREGGGLVHLACKGNLMSIPTCLGGRVVWPV